MMQLLIIACLMVLGMSFSLFECKKTEEVELHKEYIFLAIDSLKKSIESFGNLIGFKLTYGGGHPQGDTYSSIVALTNGN